jgi:hypothetical protein
MNGNKRSPGGLFQVAGLVGSLVLCVGLVGCATTPDSSPALLQQAEADLVVNFQSWNAISFIKPDVAAVTGVLTSRPKTFTRQALVKLLDTLKTPRGFVVVVLDRRYSAGAKGSAGGIDDIQTFFEGLGFQRVAFQDGAAWTRTEGLPIVRDTGAKMPQ